MVELFAPRKVKLHAIRIDNDQVPVTPSQRYMQRPRKLTPAEELSLRSLAQTQSLRSLAADFGVSHETVRLIVQARKARK
jgi:FixJ family two-component response regulator